MKRVLILGINGYIGGLSAEALSHLGFIVDGVGTVPFVDPKLGFVDKYFQIQEYLTDLAFKIEEYDEVIFCISLDHNKTELNYRKSIDVNCGILSELLQVCLKSNRKPRITYLSTMQVYSHQNCFSGQIDLTNMYGFTHYACEKLLSLYPNSLILRLANVYGPPITERANIDWTLIASICKGLAKTGIIELRNNGTATRNFLFVKDYQDMLSKVIGSKTQNYEIIDFIGNSNASVGKVKKLLEELARVNKIDAKIIIPEDYILESEAILEAIDTKDLGKTGVRSLIGEHELKTGLTETINYYRGISCK